MSVRIKQYLTSNKSLRNKEIINLINVPKVLVSQIMNYKIKVQIFHVYLDLSKEF